MKIWIMLKRVLQINLIKRMANLIRNAFAYCLYRKYDWWDLKERAMEAGYGSVWSEAYRLCNLKGNFFIGEDATIKNRPILPHGTNGLFISGGGHISEKM